MTATIAHSHERQTSSPANLKKPKHQESGANVQGRAAGSLACRVLEQGASEEGVNERVKRCIGVYVRVLSKVDENCGEEVAQLSGFWLRALSVCLSCECGLDALARKLNAVLSPQDELLPTLLRALLLQATLLAARTKSVMEPPDPPAEMTKAAARRKRSDQHSDLSLVDQRFIASVNDATSASILSESLPPTVTPFIAPLHILNAASSTGEGTHESLLRKSRDRTYSDIPVSDTIYEEGVDVPQVDLDELLLPLCHPLRPGLENTLFKRYRNRSNSDMPLHQPIDLRPNWMRSPRLFKSVIAKMNAARHKHSPPLFYVEWNILGLRKAVDRRESVRLVSPMFTPVSSNPSARVMSLGPLRIMITLERSEPLTENDHSDNQQLQMGIFFTLADDVEVSYRLFHPSFLSESRSHSFRRTPWAGLRGCETGSVSVAMSEVVTVGVAIESLESGDGDGVSSCGETGVCWDGRTLPSMSSLMGAETARTEDLCASVCLCDKVQRGYEARSLSAVLTDAKLPMQQSLSKMALSTTTAADRKLFAHIWKQDLSKD